jgi:uncharacterized membrane protein
MPRRTKNKNREKSDDEVNIITLETNDTKTEPDIKIKWVILALIGMIFGAGWISFFFLSPLSLRLDESQSLWQTSFLPENILQVVSEDVHVPLYHLMLHFWINYVGQNIGYDRIISLFFFLISIVAIYILAAYTTKKRSIALFAAFLLSISAYAQWYSSELRMYTLLLLMSICNQYFFLKIWSKGRQTDWVGYLLTSLLGIYTHYFFLLLLFTEFIFWIVYKPKQRAFYFNIILTYVTLALAYAPWLLLVKSHNLISNTQPMLAKPTSIDIFNIFSQLALGYQDNPTNTIIVACWPLIIALIFLYIQKGVIKIETVFYLFTTFIPIILAYLVSVLIRPAFLSRYLIFILPSMLILISQTIFNLKLKGIDYALRVLVVVVMIFCLNREITSSTNPAKENFRDLSSYISSSASFKDVVALSAPFLVYPFEYYYTGKASINTIPSWNRFKDKSIPGFSQTVFEDQINQFKTKYNQIWLVLDYDQGYNQIILDYFQTHFHLNQQKEFSAGLILYNYQLKYN